MCERGKLEKQPNLFLIGGMRCGTTTLHLMLGQHPDIFMSPVKEPYFYVAEAMRRKLLAGSTADSEPVRQLSEYVKVGKYRTADTYARLFEKAKHEKYIGESSHYLYHPEVAHIIFEDCPEARIIVSLRNPAERLYSEYLLYCRAGSVKESFQEFVRRRCRFDEKGVFLGPRDQSRIFKGFYYRLLREWLRVFGSSQVKIVLYEDFACDPVGICQSIFRWLGVDPNFVPDEVCSQPGGVPRMGLLNRLDNSRIMRPIRAMLKRVLPRMARYRLRFLLTRAFATRPDMEPEIKGLLAMIYREDIENLKKHLGLDLTAWK